MAHRICIALVSVVVVSAGLGVGQAQNANQDAVLLRQAITREVVDGDRPAAMALYRKLAGSADRAVATEAGTRLAALEAGQQPSQLRIRRLFEGGMGRPSRDGRLIPRLRDNGLELFDVSTGVSRRLVEPLTGRSESIDGAVVSPDGARVVYGHRDFEHGSRIVVINADGSGRRVVLAADSDTFTALFDVSADGRDVLVGQSRGGDQSELSWISLSNGDRRAMYTGSFGAARVAPDGRYLVLVDGQDLFSLTAGGGTPVPLVEHPAADALVGWAPDGRLVFVSDRSGRRGLWALRVENGRAVGEPELVLNDIGQDIPEGLTSTGHMFYRQLRSSAEVYFVRLDATGGVESGPTAIASRFVGVNTEPDYSPDGRFLAYVSGLPASSEIRVRTLATGEERVLPKPVRNIAQLRWYPDSRALLVRGGSGGGPGLHRLDIDSGATSTVVERVAGFAAVNPMFSPDGRYLYFEEFASPDVTVLVRMDTATGAKEEVLRPAAGLLRLYSLSPDGTRIAYNLRRDNQDFVYVVPVSGGSPTLVHEVPKTEWARAFGGLAWAADGRSIFYHREPGTGDELIRIPATGGAFVPLFQTGIIRHIAVHPDGRQLAVDARSGSSEIFVMENVFPAASR